MDRKDIADREVINMYEPLCGKSNGRIEPGWRHITAKTGQKDRRDYSCIIKKLREKHSRKRGNYYGKS